MRRRYVLKNKRRFATIVLLFSLITIFAGLIVNAGAASKVQEVHDIIRVQQGDTLWEIAMKYSPQGDIRNYIYNVKALNQLETDDIYAGQLLYLP